ncbi:MAG: DUF4348 domain-containing protein [Bacteroidaceae bacterium]
MRRLLFGLLFAASFVACGEKKVQVTKNTVSVDSDTVVSAQDTIAELPEDANPPKSADELFDDFLYSFTSSRKFQKKRVVFPLKVSVDGKKSMLHAKEWSFDRLYQGEESYTVLFNREKDMRLEKDTSLKRVKVEWLYLYKQRTKQYLFEKVKGQWHLTAISYASLSKHAHHHFLNFYKQFTTDSLFQRRSIRNPLTFVTYDEENEYQIIEGSVDTDQWFAFRPELPKNVITNIDYGQTFVKKNTCVVVIRGVANSMQSILTFHQDKGNWKLTKFEN